MNRDLPANISTAFILVFATLLTACKDDPHESAMKELQKKEFAFNEDSYLKAASEGNLEAVKLFQQAGVKLDLRDKDGKSALLEAAEAGKPDVVKFLLEQKADHGITDKDGNTPLIKAVESGQPEVVKALLESGADAAATNKKSETALIIAAVKDQSTVIPILASKTSMDDINKALMMAAVKGNTASVGQLLNSGADAIARTTNGDITPLIFAAKNGHLAVVEQLVNHGANINSIDSNKKTALDYARENSHKEVEDFLVEAIKTQPTRKISVTPDVAQAQVAKRRARAAARVASASGGSAPAVSATGPSPHSPTVASNSSQGPIEGEGDGDGDPIMTTRLSNTRLTGAAPEARMRMVGYQAQNLPLRIEQVTENTVQVRLLNDVSGKTVTLNKKDKIPGTDFIISEMSVEKRLTKTSGNTQVDVSRVLLHNPNTGEELLARSQSVPQTANTEAILGLGDDLYSARKNDEFTTENGQVYQVVEIYSNRLVLLNKTTNQTKIVRRDAIGTN
jgi:ankyrin repeat protein